jgi:hypothetical protein
MSHKTLHYTTAVTSEVVVCAGRCRLWGLRPNLTTTGTITLRKGAAGGSDVFSLSAIGLTQAGKDFDGVVIPNGLTIQQSVGTDLCTVIYEPF